MSFDFFRKKSGIVSFSMFEANIEINKPKYRSAPVTCLTAIGVRYSCYEQDTAALFIWSMVEAHKGTDSIDNSLIWTSTDQSLLWDTGTGRV